MSKSSAKTPPAATLLDYLRLFRIPNVFTSLADVAMGFMFVHPIRSPGYEGAFGDQSDNLTTNGVFLLLLLASGLLYTAGIVLNDVYDVDVDAKERPGRPLPSGKIPVSVALRIGYGMLGGGVVVAILAGLLSGGLAGLGETAVLWRAGVIAILLAGVIVAYDTVLKPTALAPIAMGGCRFLNVLLGMSVAVASSDAGWQTLNFTSAQLLAAAGIGVYIAGVTLFARTEAVQSNRLQLAAGLAIMVAGIVLLGLFPQFLSGERLAGWEDPSSTLNIYWPLILAVLSITVVRRCGVAVYGATPRLVQPAVKNAIFSLIILDAAVCFLMSGPDAAVLVLLLLVPTLLLGYWIEST